MINKKKIILAVCEKQINFLFGKYKVRTYDILYNGIDSEEVILDSVARFVRFNENI